MSELARRRWRIGLVAVLVAAVCVAAGVWQWSRHVQRSAAVDLVRANYSAAAVPAEQLITGPGAPVADEDVWRPVRLEGRYLDGPVLLRNRPVGGTPGFHVLEPLRVESGPLAGAVLVVDRGWVPTQDGAGPASVPGTPEGTTQVVVRLRADEPASRRDAPEGQVQAISVAQVREASAASWDAADTIGGYGALVTEDGSRPDGLGPLAAPSTSLGSNLSYAFQWWVFALGALVGAVVLARREERGEDEGTATGEATPIGGTVTGSSGTASPPAHGRPTARPASGRAIRSTRRRRPTAEEEEDAILDAQEAPTAQADAP